MASDVEKRIAKALLSARSHIGSCRPDYDEDDAAWWDELTELAELVTQPAASGEVVAEIVMCEGIGGHTVLKWRDGLVPFLMAHRLGTKLYTHPPAAEVRELVVTDEMVDRALEAREPIQRTKVIEHFFSRGRIPLGHWNEGRLIVRAILEAALSPPGRVEGESY